MMRPAEEGGAPAGDLSQGAGGATAPHGSASGSGQTATGSPDERLPRRLVVLLAVAVGAAIANLYYIQPLLEEAARVFGVSATAAGLLVTGTQVGYVAGLALLVPLGDLLERRRLVVTMLLAAAAVAAGCAAAPSLPVLAVALTALGLLSVVAAVLVPLAATLAGDRERGQVVGLVMSGLLLGILLARTVSGLLAELGGFRVVFGAAAAVMIALAVLLARALPHLPAPERLGYRAALRSVLELIAAEPVLRRRMVIGFTQMASFSALWTTVAFLIAGDPYHYNQALIGLFGLVGAAGALITPVAGRLADRGRQALPAFLTCTLVSWPLLALGERWLPALVAGIALLDLGVNGTQVSNQAAIYALRPQARSRLTTAHSIAFFLGGATGSLLAATVYGSAGWLATCALGAALAAVGLTVRR